MEVFLRASSVAYTSLGGSHGRDVDLGEVGSADVDEALACVPRAGANQVAISLSLSWGTHNWPSLIEVADRGGRLSICFRQVRVIMADICLVMISQ